MKRWLGPLLSFALIIGVGVAIYLSVQEQFAQLSQVSVRGLIGSEKEEFFQDPLVQAILHDHQLDVHIQKAGSRQIAIEFELDQYDFAFPAGLPAAEKIRREHDVHKFYNPFFTPMTVASWQPIAKLLAANGIAKAHRDGYYSLNMAALLDAIAAQKRWNELDQNAAYPVNKSILITSTDVRRSNSAAMYLALASYVANNNSVVQTDADIARVQPLIEALFLRQGFTAYSSEAPFEDYLVMGMGKAPLVMMYESQFIYRIAARNGSITAEMVLMYPEPTLFTKHTFLPFSPAGERLGELLENNPELQRLAVQHGFRTRDLTYFREFTREHGVTVADNLVNVIEPPSYEIIERMIQLIEQRYQ